MALKPTIYKLQVDLSDVDRGFYDTLPLTLAQHPSETLERMMVRVLAYCLHASQEPVFGKGVSSIEEADLWQKSLDGRIQHWIDVGEPSVERIRKACNLADAVTLYGFNTKAELWWQQSADKASRDNLTVHLFPWAEIRQLARMVQRTMRLSVTITGQSAYIATDQGECEVAWRTLSG